MSAEPGIKVCGREFIRAIIDTCGGSRWKRLLNNQNDPFQTSADKGDFKEMDSMKNLQRMFGNDRNQEVDLSFVEQVIDEYYNQHNQLPKDFIEYLRQIDGGSNNDPASASSQMQHLPWARSFRKKRATKPGLSTNCCYYGCTKKDISILC
ncbi:relaxin-3-like [Carcharodon carcharias]|uniref:relaxin-3-like n=1 Tax=Carcharodon carcharias TaxID=13397 RepID=UPI001B7DD371|nr:relaxin-3-like [Carcharodon carcharias]